MRPSSGKEEEGRGQIYTCVRYMTHPANSGVLLRIYSGVGQERTQASARPMGTDFENAYFCKIFIRFMPPPLNRTTRIFIYKRSSFLFIPFSLVLLVKGNVGKGREREVSGNNAKLCFSRENLKFNLAFVTLKTKYFFVVSQILCSAYLRIRQFSFSTISFIVSEN